MTSSSANVKRLGPQVEKRVDNQTQLYPPLDFSFRNAQRIEGKEREEKREFVIARPLRCRCVAL